MKKSFAFCDVFILTPCPLSASELSSTLPTARAERGMRSQEAGAAKLPRLLITSPSPEQKTSHLRASAGEGEGGGGRRGDRAEGSSARVARPRVDEGLG